LMWDVTYDVRMRLHDENYPLYGWVIRDEEAWNDASIPSPKFYSKEMSLNEPVLKVYYSTTYKSNYEITSDPSDKEVGGYSISSYPSKSGGYIHTHKNVDDFCSYMESHGWILKYRYEDSQVSQSKWEDSYRGHYGYEEWILGGDNNAGGCDSIDMAYFAGHGSPLCIRFGYDSSDCVTPGESMNSVDQYEIRWGDLDVEWIVLDSCYTVPLEDEGNKWDGRFCGVSMSGISVGASIHSGLHVICGFSSETYFYCDSDWDYTRGEAFAKYICQGYNIRQAWENAVIESRLYGEHMTLTILYSKVFYGGRWHNYLDEVPDWGAWADPIYREGRPGMDIEVYVYSYSV